MNMVNNGCSPLRNNSFNSRLNCAASRGRRVGQGSRLRCQEKQGGGFGSLPQLPTSESRNTSSGCVARPACRWHVIWLTR